MSWGDSEQLAGRSLFKVFSPLSPRWSCFDSGELETGALAGMKSRLQEKKQTQETASAAHAITLIWSGQMEAL